MKKQKNPAAIDVYRITLFKRKIREMISMPQTRFYFSKGRCHLVIKAWDYYPRHTEAAEYIFTELKRNGVSSFVLRDPLGLHWKKLEHLRPAYSVNIPIDQEALPERKR